MKFTVPAAPEQITVNKPTFIATLVGREVFWVAGVAAIKRATGLSWKKSLLLAFGLGLVLKNETFFANIEETPVQQPTTPWGDDALAWLNENAKNQ